MSDRRGGFGRVERLGERDVRGRLVLTRPNGKLGFDLEITPDNVVLAKRADAGSSADAGGRSGRQAPCDRAGDESERGGAGVRRG